MGYSSFTPTPQQLVASILTSNLRDYPDEEGNEVGGHVPYDSSKILREIKKPSQTLESYHSNNFTAIQRKLPWHSNMLF